jgi:hypothetical protein
MFSFFKRKKVYYIEYRDNWGNYHRVIIEAINPARAWEKCKRGYHSSSPYAPAILISLKEVE